MADLSSKYKKIINNLEKSLKDKQELEYVKEQVFAITSLFLDELDKIIEISENKMQDLVASQAELQKKISKVENSVNEIERDIYMEDSEEFEFQITCPYCNHEFTTDLTSTTQEVECPDCKNIIELDWNEDDCSSCGSEDCSGCHGHHEDEDM